MQGMNYLIVRHVQADRTLLPILMLIIFLELHNTLNPSANILQICKSLERLDRRRQQPGVAKYFTIIWDRKCQEYVYIN